MKEAKDLCREFRRKFLKLMNKQGGEDVFQLCMQLYPLTNTDLEKDKKKNTQEKRNENQTTK